MTTPRKRKAPAGRPAPICSGWNDTGYSLPEDGEWVLHTYYGVRPPEYGLFKNGRFLRHSGPESFPTTHWLRIPAIDGQND